MSGVEHQNAIKILNDVVLTKEVNWFCVLTTLAIILNVHSSSSTLIKGKSKKN